MKKLSFFFLAALVAANLVSCAGDGGGCSLEGEWKTKTVDFKSDKLDKSIQEIATQMMLKTTYKFTLDSVTIKSGSTGGDFAGTYSVDPTGRVLSWKTLNAAGNAYDDNLKIVDCSSSELTIIKRNPSDTTMEALTLTTMVLEKTK